MTTDAPKPKSAAQLLDEASSLELLADMAEDFDEESKAKRYRRQARKLRAEAEAQKARNT